MNRQAELLEEEKRWEMIELKGHQQEEMEGKLQLHLCLMLMECMSASLKVHNLKVSCWIYWKKYGGLKTPTQLEGAARGTTVRMDEEQVGESSKLIDVSFRRRPEHPAPVR